MNLSSRFVLYLEISLYNNCTNTDDILLLHVYTKLMMYMHYCVYHFCIAPIVMNGHAVLMYVHHMSFIRRCHCSMGSGGISDDDILHVHIQCNMSDSA